MNKVRMSLEFAGVILPIGKDDQGREVVPLKPFVDVFGVDWKTQYRKVSEPRMARRLGTCREDMPHAGQVRGMVCIRLDRVAAYLNTINPDRVRAAGNEDGADFLEQKQAEWDDLIHEYEMAGGMFANREQREANQRVVKMRAFVAISREKRASGDEEDRKAMASMMKGLAAELGVPYQSDILDD